MPKLRYNYFKDFYRGSCKTPSFGDGHHPGSVQGDILQVGGGFCKSLYKETLIGLLCVMITIMTCFLRPLYAQSGIGVGIVSAAPFDVGGLNVSYKAIQIFPGIQSSDGDVYIDIAIRYNHSVRDWKRMKFKVFGQAGRHAIRNESGFTSRYRFTGGGSAGLRIGGKPAPKGWFLILDIGLSIDHLGKLGTAPARGMGIHFFF